LSIYLSGNFNIYVNDIATQDYSSLMLFTLINHIKIKIN